MPKQYRLLLGLVLGVILGALAHPHGDWAWLEAAYVHVLQPLGQIFLRLLLMTVVPLVFSALVLGVLELAQGHDVGKVATKTLAFTLALSTASVVIGVSLVNVIRPGAGFTLNAAVIEAQKAGVQTIQKNAAEAKSFSAALIDLIPKNPLDSAARALSGEMIALMVFALIFGLAFARVIRTHAGGGADNPLKRILEQTLAISMKIVDFAMALGPFGVFAIVFGTIYKNGSGILSSLGLFVLTVVGGLLIQQFLVYAPLLRGLTGRSPMEFFKGCRSVYLNAFSTASSNATLPLSLETAERDLKLCPRISRFVLTVGATANQNGTALFEGVTVLFLAQVYQVDLSFSQQIQVVFMSILAGVGTAGVPGGSLPLIMILLTSLGIPAEGIGLILGADRFLDMCRTTLNVSGDLVIAALVEGRHREPA